MDFLNIALYTSPHSLDSKLAIKCDLFRPFDYLKLG